MCYPAEDAISTVSIDSEDSTSIPTSITVTMSTNTPTKNPAKRGIDAISTDSNPSVANDAETSSVLQQILGELRAFKGDVNRRFDEMNRRFDRIEGALNPQVDPFFKVEFVEQSESIEKREPTWTLMKIKRNGVWRCIGVTAAHLIGSNRLATKSTKLFIELPRSFYEAGVSAVMLHPHILDNESSICAEECDLMIVVLKEIPSRDENQAQLKMKDLLPYPRKTIPYNSEWRQKRILGRASLDFVKGRRVTTADKPSTQPSGPKPNYYVFIPESCEKGDSGTILYADFGDTKEMVGLYTGSRRVEGSRGDRGVITPAIGWKNLRELNPVYGLTEVEVQRTQDEYTFSAAEYQVESGNFKLKTSNRPTMYGTIVEVPGNMNTTFYSNAKNSESENHGVGVQEEDRYEMEWH